MATDSEALSTFHPAVQAWFRAGLGPPTRAQALGWPPLRRGESTLLLAPTGSGKTLAAFLVALERLAFGPPPAPGQGCRVLYLSPLKALAVDVERNLQRPLEGIAAAAAASGAPFRRPAVAVRTGDTPQKERARFGRAPADILITTPESLYLLLTSAARAALRGVETVIVDEIHALVPLKRGAHLALSLERLEHLCGRRLQRIGLSATQRPLEEVARFLGGLEGGAPRPVTIVDASAPRPLGLSVEVPVEDLKRPTPAGTRPTLWAAIHPRLVELIRAHRTTLLFVNARRSAERLAAALNDLAGEVLVHAHHGSLAREQRTLIEGQLKAGQLKGLVATSSLELGIDMGTIDLVIQVEAPPSVASALQRVGRSGHQVGGTSEGLVFPKFRQDLLACAALAGAMREGAVEATRYPRTPLDVLAQQVVAMVGLEPWPVEALLEVVRRAAPFAGLTPGTLEGVLDLLSGHYPAEDFPDLRPRLTWDRVGGRLTAREGARRVAVVNGGTIPDRGLYGVFLAGAPPGQARVGELDEEMVSETKPGETFVLGASTWRIEAVTFDRVLVSPAPGEPGKLPFWRGEQQARPLEFGRRIGALVRTLGGLSGAEGQAHLEAACALEPRAARNLLTFLADQRAAGAVPDDVTVVVERTRDEVGDWRVCVLSPLGGQVLAPWAMAVTALARERLGVEAETMWSNDGFIVRLPETEGPPPLEVLVPRAAEVERLVRGQLGSTAFFAARFRENAARALLLTRRRPGQRTPLWQLRKKAGQLLEVASRFPAFPLLLETYRECQQDLFDLPALVRVLAEVEAGAARVAVQERQTPSPFAASLLFGYVANFLYDGDVPPAERRAQALTVDLAQLEELLGEGELRELLDPRALAELEAALQRTPEPLRARSVDGVHDLLLRLGDLSPAELAARVDPPALAQQAAGALLEQRRAVRLDFGGGQRLVPVEQAARYRDGLGLALPPGLPPALLAPVPGALEELLTRYARTHGPFPATAAAARLGLAPEVADATLRALAAGGRLQEGAFRPGGQGREYVDPEVLRTLRQRSLQQLRRAVQPVAPEALGRLLLAWHGVGQGVRGPEAVLRAVERLQGLPLLASSLEAELLPARVEQYLPSDLDALAAAGEVVWVGLEPAGARDGRIALFLTDHLPRLHRPRPVEVAALPERERRLLEALELAGASFFPALHEAAGGGFPQATADALWALVWAGLVTNDSFFALRARLRPAAGGGEGAFRSRRSTPPAGEGRWTLLARRGAAPAPSDTAWAAATAQQLLARHGLVTREVALAEGLPGGFQGVREVLQWLEETGRARRGYFVEGVGAMQFALPEVLEQLRALAAAPAEGPGAVGLPAADPANPYGALLPWPAAPGGPAPARAAGATVVLARGALAAWAARGLRHLVLWWPEDPALAAAVAGALAAAGRRAGAGRRGVLVETVDGVPAQDSPHAARLVAAGFSTSSAGLQLKLPGRPRHRRGP